MALGKVIPRDPDSLGDRLADMGLGGSDGIEGHEVEALESLRADSAGRDVFEILWAE